MNPINIEETKEVCKKEPPERTNKESTGKERCRDGRDIIPCFIVVLR